MGELKAMKRTIAAFHRKNEEHLRLVALSQLSQIESDFAKLILLSMLRSDDSRAARTLFGEAALTATGRSVMHAIHKSVFRQWLGLPLQRQQSDLRPYLATLPNTGQFPPRICFLQFCEDLMPPEASMSDVKLFLANIEVLAQLDWQARSRPCRRKDASSNSMSGSSKNS